MVPLGRKKRESDMERDYQIEELTDEQLSEVSGGGLILAEIATVVGIAITGGIAAGIMSVDMGTLKGPLQQRP
jgi:lactobin A/cerein 7B family class IIb bacteriocin